MADGPVWFDDADLKSAGFAVVRSSGLDDGIPEIMPTMDIAGGVAVAGARGRRGVRPITVELVVQKWTVEEIVEAGHVLRERMLRGQIAIRHAFRPDRRLWARCTSPIQIQESAPQYLAPYTWQCPISFEATNPIWEALSESTVSFNNTPDDFIVGTTDSKLSLMVEASGGTVTNPVITIYDADDVAVQTISPTVAILNGDAWRYDAVRGAVEKRVSGVWSNARNTLTLSTLPPVLRAIHARRSAGQWGSVGVSAGIGTGKYRINDL